MAIPFAALLFILAASGAAEAFSTPDFDEYCLDKWKSLFAEHTICIVGDVGTDVDFDPQTVVDYHNQKRGAVDPAATDMRKVSWDEEAAAVAAKWARQCNKYGDHDKHEARQLPSYKFMSVGQNKAMNMKQDWKDAIDMWYNEVNNFVYGQGASPSTAVIGHYAQLVSKDVYRIGCGMAACPGNEYYYICNYITGDYSKTKPYTSGTRCASCPDQCTDGLCDCGSTVCKFQSSPANGCGCTCQPHMSGHDCASLTCQSDAICSHVPGSYCRYKWTGTKNFIRYMCPEKCGLC